MTESTGYHESPDTADAPADLVDGQTGDNASDGGEADTISLTTDDDAQEDDSVVRSGNSSG